MERNEFLSKLGIGVVAVCTGCIAACGSKGGNPTPNPPGGGGGGGGNKLTANLDTEITAVGQSKTGGGIIVARIAEGNTAAAFTAVQSACTHEGFTIGYNAAQGKFICPNHGSQFSTSGAVLLGPATSALHKYSITIADNILTVTS